MNEKQWFGEWFDTPYYHVLYKNRDEQEAKSFINQLIRFLKLPPNGLPILDLACGKGRHSVTLNALDYTVVGVDLSANSISEAQKFANDSLTFFVHDMREVIEEMQFQAVFNLFTSFGYFDETSDNEKVLQAINQMLDEKGMLVIDFMNASKVIAHLVEEENKEVDGILFHLKREYDGNHIHKFIEFEADNTHYKFKERVQALQLCDFKELLAKTGFDLICTFGDFHLNPFDVEHSNRLILIAQKV